MGSRAKIIIIRPDGKLFGAGVTLSFFAHNGSACRRLR